MVPKSANVIFHWTRARDVLVELLSRGCTKMCTCRTEVAEKHTALRNKLDRLTRRGGAEGPLLRLESEEYSHGRRWNSEWTYSVEAVLINSIGHGAELMTYISEWWYRLKCSRINGCPKEDHLYRGVMTARLVVMNCFRHWSIVHSKDMSHLDPTRILCGEDQKNRLWLRRT